MKFRELKRFLGEKPEEAISWIRNELNSLLRELYIGLGNLKFQDNFKTFRWEGTIAAGVTTQIVHPFKVVPSGWLNLKQVGNGVVDASTSEWTTEVVYLRNNGASSVTLTAIFFE